MIKKLIENGFYDKTKKVLFNDKSIVFRLKKTVLRRYNKNFFVSVWDKQFFTNFFCFDQWGKML